MFRLESKRSHIATLPKWYTTTQDDYSVTLLVAVVSYYLAAASKLVDHTRHLSYVGLTKTYGIVDLVY